MTGTGDRMKEAIHISVRPLVEYVHRSGSIHSGFRSNSSMLEGTRVHQVIQKGYREHDRKEVYLRTEIPYQDALFIVEGRCDGLIQLDGVWTVDEIKSISLPLEEIQGDGQPVHWAQAFLYAYMIAREEQHHTMQVQLTYVQAHSEDIRRFRRQLSFAELESFAQEMIAGYAPYAFLLRAHAEKRDASIGTLDFPFDTYRSGQRTLAGSVYKTIAEGVNLFAKAPTGIGKTISTLFPAIKAIGEGVVSRVYYVTARTTTRAAAEEAYAKMQTQGLHVHVVTLTAKDKICFKDENDCDAGACSMCEGYYDRINGAVSDILANETLMTRAVIEHYARKHRVCPFEFSLDVAYASDGIISDYNYVFDPRISLKRLLEEHKRKGVVLVDEAHNLVERGREMFSAEMLKSPFLELKREFKLLSPETAAAASAVNAHMITLRKLHADAGKAVEASAPQELLELLVPFVEAAERELVTRGSVSGAQHASSTGAAYAMLLDTYFAAQNMLRIAALYDERYVTYIRAGIEAGRSEVRVKLFCLDPSHLLGQAIKGYRSTIYFSATLTPLAYYRDMLGAKEEDYTLQVPSPFHQEQWDVRLLPLSIRYRDRERSKGAIVNMLAGLAEERKGNILVFFPSYPYLREVYEEFMIRDVPADTLVQSPGMTEPERDRFLEAFQPGQERTLLGFAVLGGVFAEGVDLPGDRLNGVVVVGVGLPQIGAERDVLREYFAEQGRNGFNYAYVYPGMNKVLQAGGRLIRTEQDEGLLVLVDDRFAKEPYASLLPEEWRSYRLVEQAGLGKEWTDYEF
ncbi:ATP-dependent helicase [Paenibacillus kribbensis]|uniref:ATP-dependent helicase n=1 Tax=Paenibacillus kribbensis TaxID=172713 RepID=A0A222WHR4_9BACL|nr:ATP-dependent DNA helicase [Paenibacillus kribbensis]ASR45433.1 ATP-dependent helicase [Paenibacillus kribbensis]